MMMGTPTPTPLPSKEIADLASRADALRAAIARAQSELEVVSAEERALSDRIAHLRSNERPERPDPRDDPARDPARDPAPAERHLVAAWVRAPFAKKTNDFEKGPPRAAAKHPATRVEQTETRVEQTETALLTNAGLTTARLTTTRLRLQRREAWKVAAAGAGLATLLGSLAIAVYFELAPPPTPTPTPTKTTPTASPPLLPPAAPLPSAVAPSSTPTTTSDPPLSSASPLFTSPWRRRVSSPSPPPPPTTPRTSVEEADRILSGALGATAPSGMGAITVICVPKCDHTIDNGVSLGPGHIFNRPVATGRHVLQLSAPTGARKTVTINVAEGVTREIRVAMDAPPPAPAPAPPPAPAPAPSAD